MSLWSGHWSTTKGHKGWEEEWEDNRWAGDHRGNQWTGGSWGGSQRISSKKWGKDEDRFANCSTLGLKHPLALDDRREIIFKLLNKLQEDVAILHRSRGGMNFRLAVASWGPILIHAVLYLLCKVAPGMRISLLRNERQEFFIDDVVEQFYWQLCEVHPTTEDKDMVFQMISACRWGSPTTVIAAATDQGFNPSEIEDQTKFVITKQGVGEGTAQVLQRIAAAGGEGSTRMLQSMASEEELARLSKRDQILELREQLMEREATLGAAAGKGAPANPICKQQPSGLTPEHTNAIVCVFPGAALQPVAVRSASALGANAETEAPAAEGKAEAPAAEGKAPAAGGQDSLGELVCDKWKAMMGKLSGQGEKADQMASQSCAAGAAGTASSAPALEAEAAQAREEMDQIRKKMEADAAQQEQLLATYEATMAKAAAAAKAADASTEAVAIAAGTATAEGEAAATAPSEKAEEEDDAEAILQRAEQESQAILRKARERVQMKKQGKKQAEEQVEGHRPRAPQQPASAGEEAASKKAAEEAGSCQAGAQPQEQAPPPAKENEAAAGAQPQEKATPPAEENEAAEPAKLQASSVAAQMAREELAAEQVAAVAMVKALEAEKKKMAAEIKALREKEQKRKAEKAEQERTKAQQELAELQAERDRLQREQAADMSAQESEAERPARGENPEEGAETSKQDEESAAEQKEEKEAGEDDADDDGDGEDEGEEDEEEERPQKKARLS